MMMEFFVSFEIHWLSHTMNEILVEIEIDQNACSYAETKRLSIESSLSINGITYSIFVLIIRSFRSSIWSTTHGERENLTITKIEKKKFPFQLFNLSSPRIIWLFKKQKELRVQNALEDKNSKTNERDWRTKRRRRKKPRFNLKLIFSFIECLSVFCCYDGGRNECGWLASKVRRTRLHDDRRELIYHNWMKSIPVQFSSRFFQYEWEESSSPMRMNDSPSDRNHFGAVWVFARARCASSIRLFSFSAASIWPNSR